MTVGAHRGAQRQAWLPLAVHSSERLLGYALLAPALVLVFGLVGYPILYDLALSLTETEAFSGPGRFVGLANFGSVLADREFRVAAWNSFLYTAVTVTLRLLLGVGMALLLWRLRRGRAVVFLALFVPWAFPSALSGFAFYWLLSPPFHTFYTLQLLELRFALADLLGQDLWHVGAIALHDVWRSSAFIAIFLLAGLSSIPSALLDYAQIECRSEWQRFWQVTLPLGRKFLVLALLLSLVLGFTDYASMYLQTGGRITWPLLGTLAYRTIFFNGETALGAAITLAQLPVWFLVVWIGFRLFEREPRTSAVAEVNWAADRLPSPARRAALSSATRGGTGDHTGRSLTGDPPSSSLRADAPAVWARLKETEEQTEPSRRSERKELSLRGDQQSTPRFGGDTRPQELRRSDAAVRWRRELARVWLVTRAGLVVAFAIFPVWWIILQAVRPVTDDLTGNPFWTWTPTLEGFAEALHGRNFGRWMLNTGIVLSVGITLTLVTSVLAGYALGRLPIPGRRWIARLLFATYFLPQPLVLIPIYQVFAVLNLDNTLGSVILLYQTLTIPFATWLCFSYFDGLPPDIEEHATLDGSRWPIFRRIVLPMSWPVIIAAGVFAAGVMASDFIYGGLLLIHDDTKTIAVGLGLIGITLNEFDRVTGGIGLAALPLVIACAAFAPAYVRGLSAAMVEGS